ncbi:MAG: ABC transporter substrate-binding protein, partial [Actinobacteria bacterium]|nr:ABC transporter substrate-binding protein [Actinomycetota bacterium]
MLGRRSIASPLPVPAVLAVLVLAAAACTPTATSTARPSGQTAAPSSGCGARALDPAASAGCATPAAPGTALTVGLGYIPSVQFAPFYLAQNAGYYRDAGLEVTFENKIDPDLVTLVGQGSIDVGVADGTSVIPAV